MTDIQPGDELPDFEARTPGGQSVSYRRDVWQRKLAVVVTFSAPASAEAQAYRSALERRQRDLAAYDTVLLLSPTAKDGSRAAATIPVPSVVIADRWGEVRDVEHPTDDRGLPPIDDIVEWLRFVQTECPECQGETK